MMFRGFFGRGKRNIIAKAILEIFVGVSKLGRTETFLGFLDQRGAGKCVNFLKLAQNFWKFGGLHNASGN